MSNGNTGKFVRCFAALPVDAAVLETIRKAQHLLDKRCRSPGVKWVSPHQIHLTLRFYGNVPIESIGDLKAALGNACLGITPFELKAENTGCFPAWDRPRVIWTDLSGHLAPLMALQAKVDAATRPFGDNLESQDFIPHLTLGRVKTKSPLEMRQIGEKVRSIDIGTMGQWTAAQIQLIQSRLTTQGPEYEVLETIPLRP
jgi:2'-5' RNA ligase